MGNIAKVSRLPRTEFERIRIRVTFFKACFTLDLQTYVNAVTIAREWRGQTSNNVDILIIFV